MTLGFESDRQNGERLKRNKPEKAVEHKTGDSHPSEAGSPKYS